jgi:N-acetylmuramoyl-L-alanine amidase
MAYSIYLSPSVQHNNIGVSNYGTEAKRCNEIANFTEKELIRHGIKVYRNKPSMTLAQIVHDSNVKKATIHVAIHTNAYNLKARGSEGFCYKLGINSKGEKLIKYIYKYISGLTPTSDRGIKQGFNFYGTDKHIYELAMTTMPAALIECIFHDNIEDVKWMLSGNNIELIGIAIAKGILEYFEITYEPLVINNLVQNSVMYRVVTGSFKDRKNAEDRINDLKKAGFESFLDIFKIK